MNAEQQAGESEELKPGDTVSMRDPQSTKSAESAPPAEATQATAETNDPPAADSPSLPAPEPAPAAAPPEEEPHFFHGDMPAAQPTVASVEDPDHSTDPADVRMQRVGRSISWSAVEFVVHHKTSSWYWAFAGISIIILAIAVLISRDVFTVVAVVAALALFGYAASRPPRQMQYAVDDQGVTIDRRPFHYSGFRGFSVIQEGAQHSITLMPLRRFMLPLNLYFDPADEHRIVEILSDHLPLQETSRDPIDNLMRRIHF